MKSTKCAACGFVSFSEETCKACGASLTQRPTYTPPSPITPVYASHHNSWDDQPENPKKGMAIFALVLGILGFFTLGIIGIGAITGIILACTAMSRAKREPWKYGGRNIAIAGLCLCITSLVIAVPVGLIAMIAIPNIFASYRAANEGSAINSVRTIAQAESTYQSMFSKFGTLEELAASNLIDPKLAKGEKNGYVFTVVNTDESFEVNAVPKTYRSTGMRSFFVDESAVVRAGDNYGGPSSKNDQPLDADTEFPQRRDRRVDYRRAAPSY